VVSSFFLSFFFSSPSLSGLKCAARSLLEMQDPKNRQKSPSEHHRTTLSGCIFATEARIDNRKKTC